MRGWISKILKTNGIDQSTRSINDFHRQGHIRFVAIAHDQVIAIITANRVVGNLVVMAGQLPALTGLLPTSVYPDQISVHAISAGPRPRQVGQSEYQYPIKLGSSRSREHSLRAT